MKLLFAVLFSTLAIFSCKKSEKPNPIQSYTPVRTPNGATLPWKMVNGFKEFHLTIEEIDWEVAPGMKIKGGGYNGRTPGPTIEAVEGDKVRIYVTNKLDYRRYLLLQSLKAKSRVVS